MRITLKTWLPTTTCLVFLLCGATMLAQQDSRQTQPDELRHPRINGRGKEKPRREVGTGAIGKYL